MALSQTSALEYLRHAHEQKRLGHAYLISGPHGSGKRAVAAGIANIVNGTDPETVFAANNSEIFIASPESKSRRIVIDQVRGLEHSLQMRATNGRQKVAIVVDADRLQPQAANAFLKTLEEPPRDSLLLLLTTLPEALPDTILSRCVSLPLIECAQNVVAAEEAELVELLRTSAGKASGGVEGVYRLAQGFQRLLSGVRESILEENAAALKAEEARYKNSTDGSWLDEREDYYKALTESFYAQRRARLIETLFVWWSDVLRAAMGVDRRDLPDATNETAAIASRLKVPEILRRIRRLEELRDHLDRNIQEALAIEVAFLKVFAF